MRYQRLPNFIDVLPRGWLPEWVRIWCVEGSLRRGLWPAIVMNFGAWPQRAEKILSGWTRRHETVRAHAGARAATWQQPKLSHAPARLGKAGGCARAACWRDRRRDGSTHDRMNILMLSDVYFPRVNGVSTSMQTFCRELTVHRPLGHDRRAGLRRAGAGRRVRDRPPAVAAHLLRSGRPAHHEIRRARDRRRARAARVGRHPHPHAVSRAPDRCRACADHRAADGRELPHVLRGIRRQLPAVVSDRDCCGSSCGASRAGSAQASII